MTSQLLVKMVTAPLKMAPPSRQILVTDSLCACDSLHDLSMNEGKHHSKSLHLQPIKYSSIDCSFIVRQLACTL